MADPEGLSTISGEMPAVPRYTVERARFPLVLKLFGVTALLIAAVVGIAVAITIQRASTVARETVNKSIAGAARLFDDLEKGELLRLTSPVQLLGNDSRREPRNAGAQSPRERRPTSPWYISSSAPTQHRTRRHPHQCHHPRHPAHQRHHPHTPRQA